MLPASLVVIAKSNFRDKTSVDYKNTYISITGKKKTNTQYLFINSTARSSEVIFNVHEVFVKREFYFLICFKSGKVP